MKAARLFTGLCTWHLLLGAVSSEVVGQLGKDPVGDPDGYFEGVLDAALRLLEP